MKCVIDDCPYEQRSRRLCSGHVKRWLAGTLNFDTWEEAMPRGTVERIEEEIREGIRCKCAMLKPCLSCVPLLDHFAGAQHGHD